jgi:hypothetical protein
MSASLRLLYFFFGAAGFFAAGFLAGAFFFATGRSLFVPS